MSANTVPAPPIKSAAPLSEVLPQLPAIVTAVVLFGAWEFSIHLFHIPQYVAPAPSEVLVELFKQRRLLAQNVAPTLLEGLGGFAIGTSVAVALAILMVRSRILERSLFPIAVFIHTVPILAIAPILVLLFGTGYTPKVLIAAMLCFFPMLVNMVRGLNAISPQAFELMKILSASDWEIFRKLRFPSSVPFFFSALRVTAPTSIIGAIVGEWLGSDRGLGAIILQATYNFRAPLLYATIFIATAASMTMFWLVGYVERRVVTWQSADTH
jgi:NitT/TauT family transport system permease protein